MPDYKRINAPEGTVPYQLFCSSQTKPFKNRLKELVQEDGTRKDGRKTDEHRKIFMKTGVVSQAKGSAYIEVGNTKVIVSVFDPREIPNRPDYSLKGELYCEFKYAPFSCNMRRSHQLDSEEKQNSIIMKQALESAVCRQEFPNFQVDIYALVLQNDGSAVTAAITCAGLALVQAGVPMFDMVTSVTLGVQGGSVILDPTLDEQLLCGVAVYDDRKAKTYKSHGVIYYAMLSTHQQVSQFYQSGNFSLDDIVGSMEVLTKATKDIVPLVEKCVVKHALKSLERDKAED